MKPPPSKILESLTHILEVNHYINSAGGFSVPSHLFEDSEAFMELNAGLSELQRIFDNRQHSELKQTVNECWKAAKRIEEGIQQGRIAVYYEGDCSL